MPDSLPKKQVYRQNFYSRMIHFNAVQKFLQNHPHASWLDLTYRFNYFDQLHPIKDFHHFTGTSPKGYTALDNFLVNNFALPDIDIKSFQQVSIFTMK